MTIHHELVRKVTKKRGVLNQQTSTKMAASGFEFFLRLLLKWWLCTSKFFKTKHTLYVPCSVCSALASSSARAAVDRERERERERE